MKRLEDLTTVFDKRWKANHNDDVKVAREKEKQFMNKMYGNKNSINTNYNTPEAKLNNLNNNINAARSGQMQNNLNNIMKKWK